VGRGCVGLRRGVRDLRKRVEDYQKGRLGGGEKLCGVNGREGGEASSEPEGRID